jgi:hypothetical protein
MSRQKENQDKLSKLQKTLEFQRNQREKAIVRMERYDAELATTESIESEIL